MMFTILQAMSICDLSIVCQTSKLLSVSCLKERKLAPSAGVKLCTYHCWFGRHQNAACSSYWESPMGDATLHGILRFRMGSHHLPVEEDRHLNQPRASRVCNLCNTGALGDARHMLL